MVHRLSVAPVLLKQGGNRGEQVFSLIDLIDALQISEQSPIQVRPLVHQIVPGRLPPGFKGFLRVPDIEHALREVVVGAVRQDQPLHQAYLLPEPDLVDIKVISSIQVGEGDRGLPALAVLEVDSQFPLLEEGPRPAVFGVVVDGKSQRAVRLKKVQPRQLEKWTLQSG